MSIRFYEVSSDYIDFLSRHEKHLFRNSKPNQRNTRKYIGIVITVHDLNYFIPLSSYKQKHNRMREMVDFLKIRDYAVLNINNMLPVPEGLYTPLDFAKIKDKRYQQLLQSEYRIIKSRQVLIRKNAKIVYSRKTDPNDHSSLSKRCNDFLLLERLAKLYQIK
jgi:protein AbiQ